MGGRSWRCGCLSLELPRVKLGKTPLNGSGVNDTYECEVERLGIGDRKVAKESRDNGWKNEFITSCYVLINIYK